MIKKLNPLSEFWLSPKDGHRLTEKQAKMYHTIKFSNDVYNVDAVDENLNRIKLGTCGATDDRVDFIGGMWRIQRDFQHNITRVRDKDMVLITKINRTEGTNFEFWTAKSVGYNSYGPFINGAKESDYIVAMYETDNGVLYGYGETLEKARAFLGLKLFDEYKDVIHNIACKNRLKNIGK